MKDLAGAEFENFCLKACNILYSMTNFRGVIAVEGYSQTRKEFGVIG